MAQQSAQSTKKKKLPLNSDSWHEVTAAFENDLFRKNQSDATITTYRACLNVFSDFYLHQLNKPGPYAARLQEADLSAFIDYLRHDRQLTAASMNKYIAALKSFSKFLFINGLHRKLLAGHLKTFRVQAEPDAPRLSKSEIRRLIRAIDLNGRNGYRNLAILQLFLQCGLRVGELVRLSRDDITLYKTTGTVRVRLQAHNSMSLPGSRFPRAPTCHNSHVMLRRMAAVQGGVIQQGGRYAPSNRHIVAGSAVRDRRDRRGTRDTDCGASCAARGGSRPPAAAGCRTGACSSATCCPTWRRWPWCC